MSDETKDLLAFSVLISVVPIGVVAFLCATTIIALEFFSWLSPVTAFLVSSAVAGFFNGFGFLVLMTIGRFLAYIFSRIKGDSK